MAEPLPPSPFRAYLLAFLALVASLTLVALYWRNAQQRELRGAQDEFVGESAEIVEQMRQQLASYSLISRGAVSLFASVERPSAEQWQDYVSALQIDRQFPSLLGVGFASYLGRMQLQDMQLAERDAGRGFFTVHPAGAREHYGVAIYFAPESPESRKAVGYDMLSEPVRQAAMVEARDKGDTTLTGPLQLLRDQGSKVRGLLMLSPVYRRTLMPSSLQSRRQSLQGWAYLPFRIEAFVAVSLGSRHPLMKLRIVDVTQGEQILHSDPGFSLVRDPEGRFAHSETMQVYGRAWRIDFKEDSHAALAAGSSELRSTLIAGVVASLLLFGIALALARTESQARTIAERMSESYRRSELRFRSAMEYSAIGKALLNRDGVIVDVNPALAAIFASQHDRLLGTSFSARFIDDGDDATRMKGVDSITHSVYRTTRRIKRDTGDQRDVQLTYAPVPGDVGEDVARLVQVEDITDRLRAEARIHALNRSLEARVALRTRELTQANQELESFAYSVSHDLRAPLRAIDGFSRLLTERYAPDIDEAGRDYLLRIRNAAGRMGELIGSLLKMSRLSRGELKLSPLDLSQMATEIVAELRGAHPAREVDIVIHPGLRAAGDAPLVRNLLQN
ncbi:MAG: CHASE domain-containing protein, partial [Luteimonas sp.]